MDLEGAGNLPMGIRQHVLGFLSPSASPPPENKPNLRVACPPRKDRTVACDKTELFSFEKQALLSTTGFFIRDGLLGHLPALSLAVKVRDACVTGEIELHAAKMSHASVAQKDPRVRGDRNCWLTNHWKDPDSIFAELFTKIRFLFPEEDPQLGYVKDRTSVQLAMYPGKGARYVEHRDTAVVSASEAVRGELVRKYTVVYYLNPFWEKEERGGMLQLEGRKIDPKMDRLVVFQSKMLHQVLPCFAPRWAVTVWLYGLPDVKVPRLMPRIRSIFVAIPSYRDPDCVNTIKCLFEKAERPEELRVGVYLQLDMAHDLPSCLCQSLPKDYANRTTFKLVDSAAAAGPAYARSQVHTLLREEMYMLNIDSHTRFINNWDTILIGMLSSLPSPEKSILTTYPQGFDVEEGEDKTPDADLSAVVGPLLLKAWRFDDDNMLRLKSERQSAIASSPLQSAFCAAGFNFCVADAFRNVPYAPTEHLFFGEETVLSVRLWTHGYDFWAPHRDVLFHRWDRSYRSTFKAHPEQRWEALDWVEDLLKGKVEGDLGLGKERTVAAYEAFAGVDFSNKGILDN